jgi:hypothetical protein
LRGIAKAELAMRQQRQDNVAATKHKQLKDIPLIAELRETGVAGAENYAVWRYSSRCFRRLWPTR